MSGAAAALDGLATEEIGRRSRVDGAGDLLIGVAQRQGVGGTRRQAVTPDRRAAAVPLMPGAISDASRLAEGRREKSRDEALGFCTFLL